MIGVTKNFNSSVMLYIFILFYFLGTFFGQYQIAEAYSLKSQKQKDQREQQTDLQQQQVQKQQQLQQKEPKDNILVVDSINIGLSIDEQSMKDFLIVMQSVLTAAYDPSKIIFHLVACTNDIESSKTLQQQIEVAIKSCFSVDVKYVSVPFMLPTDSGFAQQLRSGDYHIEIIR